MVNHKPNLSPTYLPSCRDPNYLPPDKIPFIHIIRWSNIWGCLPLTYSKTQGTWNISLLLCFWSSCLIGFNFPTMYFAIKHSIDNEENLTLLVMILIVSILHLSAISCHMLSIVYYKKWIIALNNWMLFERKFPTLSVGLHLKKLSFPLFGGFFLCILFFIINIWNEVRFILINNEGVLRLLSLFYIYIIYSFIFPSPILWLIVISKSTCFYLKRLRTELETIIKSTELNFQSSLSMMENTFPFVAIENLQKAILDLMRLIESFKKILSHLILVVMTHHIVSLICFLYWTFVSVLDYKDWYFPFSFGLLSAQAIIPIFFGAIYSEDIEDQVRKKYTWGAKGNLVIYSHIKIQPSRKSP